MKLSRKKKAAIVLTADLLVILLASIVAVLLLDKILALPEGYYSLMVGGCMGFYLLLGIRNSQFNSIVRYTSLYEVVKSVKNLTCSFILAFLFTEFILKQHSIRYLFLMYVLSLVSIPGLRVGWRYIQEYANRHLQQLVPSQDRVRTLVVGAGDGGSIFVEQIVHKSKDIEIVGIVDQDRSKSGSKLYGIPVLGTEKDIPKLVEKLGVDQVTIAIPSLRKENLQKVADICLKVNVTVNQMPRIEDVMTGKVSVNRLRKIDVVDLLGREEVALDYSAIASVLRGKTVLVSGAGGSIGSEICRQLAKFQPETLLLLGHGENSIFLIHNELKREYGTGIRFVPLIADIQDKERMKEIMQKYHPDHVYHAAAHKHVPLMEYNPKEAVKNNILGTKNISEAAKAAGVSSFIMISTDKAVRPTNVMGASKRVAEMLVTSLDEPGKTKFAVVRFGNVLGSRGSVIPTFHQQIEKGGPVTVTDKRMIRYFMTIPEAARLVIQAGTLAQGGDIFILDMGDPVSIYELAKKMVRLSGYSEEEIPIVETGMRPGEKLYEELLIEGQLREDQVYEKVFVAKTRPHQREQLLPFVDSLKGLSEEELTKTLIAYANEHI